MFMLNAVVVPGWTLLGGALDNSLSADAENPAVATGSNGQPVVAWQENQNIFVSQYTTSWVDLGSSLNVTMGNAAANPALALQKVSPNINMPVVAWQENGSIFVKRWDGTAWVIYDTAIATSGEAYAPSLALDSNDVPYVSYYEYSGTSYDVSVHKWDTTELKWISLGNLLDKTLGLDAEYPSLALTSTNVPYVSWQEAGNIYVKRWTGSTWALVGNTLDKTPANEALQPVFKNADG